MADEREELNKDLEETSDNVDYSEFYGEDKEKKNGNKKYLFLIPIIVIICVICVVAAIVVERMTPSKEYADLYKYYGVDNGSVSVLWDAANSARSTSPARASTAFQISSCCLLCSQLAYLL